MKTYYKVVIDQTAKDNRNSSEEYQNFYQEIKTFKTLEEVKTFLNEQYTENKINYKKGKVYIDDTDGNAIQIGYITAGYKNSDNNATWYQQDWIGIKKIVETSVLL